MSVFPEEKPVEPRASQTARPSTRSGGALPIALLLLAALTIAARLPFLLRGDRFFDSDEAVEGLMARHVLLGEHPAFLWGQHYKGVPEVYAAAAVFSAAGSSVTALKAVTLVFFVAFVCAQFVLLDRMFSRRVAWIASLFVILGPPAFVLWTLSANAEIVLTLLAGTVLLLAVERWRTSGGGVPLAVAWAAIGFGLWVQQYIVFYIVALAGALAWQTPDRIGAIRHFVAPGPWPRWIDWVLGAIGVAGIAYFLLGSAAFLTDGFDLDLPGWSIGVHHAQKLWRISAALLLVWGGARWLLRRVATEGNASFRRLAVPVIALLIGYAPAIGHRAAHRGSAPVPRMNLDGLALSAAPIANDVVPIVFGFKGPATDRLPIAGGLAALIVAALVLSFLGARRARSPFFHVFVVATVALFLASGSYIDAQSYRYLMPLYAAIPVIYALGIDTLARWSRVAAGALLVALAALFAAQQVAWYTRLPPDLAAPAALACLDARGIRYASAGYWMAYKITFLSGERVIVAPGDGMDRYPPYTTVVSAQRWVPTLAGSGEAGAPLSCGQLVQ